MDFTYRESDVIKEVRELQASIPEKQKERLMKCLGELNRIGIDQLNLQELLVTHANVHRLEGEGYESGVLFSKKWFLSGSRTMTYEVMQHCLEQEYAFTVNDCSAGKFGKRPS